MIRNKRFKVLKTAIKKYKAPITDPTTAFYHYDRFQRGIVDYDVDATARGENLFRLIDPFGADPASEPYRVSLTGRASGDGISGTGLSELELGLASIPDDAIFIVSRNNIPAKIIVKTITGTRDSAPSQITRTPYKRQTGSSITLPFGRQTDSDRMFERQASLARAVENSPGRKSVTFKPERLYQG